MNTDAPTIAHFALRPRTPEQQARSRQFFADAARRYRMQPAHDCEDCGGDGCRHCRGTGYARRDGA